jgi:hypothetical protein
MMVLDLNPRLGKSTQTRHPDSSDEDKILPLRTSPFRSRATPSTKRRPKTYSKKRSKNNRTGCPKPNLRPGETTNTTQLRCHQTREKYYHRNQSEKLLTLIRFQVALLSSMSQL